MRPRFLRFAELLDSFGPHQVGMPHIRPLESKLWEMRMKGRDGIACAVYAAAHGRSRGALAFERICVGKLYIL